MEQDVRHPELIKEKQNTILLVENVGKTYALPTGKLTVLHNVSLHVQQGEFISMTGASGSGKTTLLSLLGALDSPDSGEIWLDTQAVHRLRGIEAADFRRQQI